MKGIFINFNAPINPNTAKALIGLVNLNFVQGETIFHILLSSSGGDVRAGLDIYNYLKYLPVEINTYNMNRVDSIANTVYCVGKKRFCVPDGNFLIHPISVTLNGAVTLEEGILKEIRENIDKDHESIASIISRATGNPKEQILELIHNRTNFNAEGAKKIQLTHEILNEDDTIQISKHYLDINSITSNVMPNIPVNVVPMTSLPQQGAVTPPENYLLKKIRTHSEALALIAE